MTPWLKAYLSPELETTCISKNSWSAKNIAKVISANMSDFD